jgi:hypothetical protein
LFDDIASSDNTVDKLAEVEEDGYRKELDYFL